MPYVYPIDLSSGRSFDTLHLNLQKLWDPCMVAFSCETSNDSPRWGPVDLMIWKAGSSRFGGGKAYIQKFKDAWVQHNRQQILAVSARENLLPELLGGVCWIEVAGDPEVIDRIAFEVRSFDWLGPDWMDKYMTITRNPVKTSFGAVSIQLATAANTLGINVASMSGSELRNLANCLENDVYNIDVVGRHLRQLANHDGYVGLVTKEQSRIIGARYNRGMSLSLEKIKENTSYGDFILKHWDRFNRLLFVSPPTTE